MGWVRAVKGCFAGPLVSIEQPSLASDSNADGMMQLMQPASQSFHPEFKFHSCVLLAVPLLGPKLLSDNAV
jgi:hypothetical protein